MRENLEHVSTGKEKIAVEIVAGLLLIILNDCSITKNELKPFENTEFSCQR